MRGSSAIVVIALLVASCSESIRTVELEPEANATTAGVSVPTLNSATNTPPTLTGDCATGGRAWSDLDSTKLLTIADEPFLIRAAAYPTPEYEARLWSQWGQGIVLDDGRFLSAVGDHEGRDGNSYFYVYDPQTNRLRMISDVLSLTDHESGDWGYGKVHAQMVAGPCGDVFVTSYWGTRSDLVFGPTYDGDILMRLDPESETIASLDTMIPGFGVPSLAISQDGRFLFAEGAEPDTDQGVFVARDLISGEEIFRDTDPGHTGFRALLVDDQGRAYYSISAGQLKRFDPISGQAEELTDRMPGEFLRAVTRPDDNGLVVAVTQDEPMFFTLDSQGSIEALGEAPGYTTSLARDGDLIYFIPDAHGSAWESGAPLMTLDLATGQQSVLVELNDLAEQSLGLRLGGTYNIAIDEVNGRLFIGLNAGPPDSDSTFGTVVLMVIDL